MSIQQVAQAALATFPKKMISTPHGSYVLPAVMVAIGGAEDGFGSGPGDPLSIYRDGGTSERPHSCGGYTSFGTWQVNLPAHFAMIASLSGIPASNPCGQAQWLADYQNCAKAALAVYQSQGLGAWTTWTTGAYLPYLAQAQASVSALVGSVQKSTNTGTTTATFIGAATPYALWGLLGLGGLAAGVVLLDEAGVFRRWRL